MIGCSVKVAEIRLRPVFAGFVETESDEATSEVMSSRLEWHDQYWTLVYNLMIY